jgi:DnaD/phage-associated family protein
MATKLPWFRLYTEILDDKKIKRVCRVTNECKALVVGVWVILLALANDSDERGKLLVSEGNAYTLADLTDETGIQSEVFIDIVNEFKKLGMLEQIDETLQIINWDSRQYKSDDSKQRVNKYRDKQKEKCNDVVTLQDCYSNGDVTPPDTDTESDTDTDTELTGAGAVFEAYEAEIGVLTPIIAESLKLLETEYKQAWILEAIKLAVQNNARKLAYVEAILKRWKAEGKGAGKKPEKARTKGRVGHSYEEGIDYAKAWGVAK